MENKNRQDRLAKLIKDMENAAIMKGTSADEVIKSLHGDEILESIKKLNEQLDSVKKQKEQLDKIFYNDYMSRLFERFERRNFSDMDVSEKASNKEDITVEPMLMHEMFYGVDFSDYAQGASEEAAFSDDEVEYDEQLKHFIDFVTLNKEFGDSTFIRVKREGNIISYSRLQAGIELDNHKIIMTKSDNLKEIYGLLKTTFGPDFVYGNKHEMFGGWSLLPSIGDKLMVEITSDDPADSEWIYNEIHNRQPVIIDELKK